MVRLRVTKHNLGKNIQWELRDPEDTTTTKNIKGVQFHTQASLNFSVRNLRPRVAAALLGKKREAVISRL